MSPKDGTGGPSGRRPTRTGSARGGSGGSGGGGRPKGKGPVAKGGGKKAKKPGGKRSVTPGAQKQEVKRDAKPRGPEPAFDPDAIGTGEWDEGLIEVAKAIPITGEIRDLDTPERDAVAELFGLFGDGILDRVEARFVLKVIGRRDIEPHRRVFAMRRPTLAHLARYDPIFLGIPVAHLSRKGARLTLEGGRLIAPHATRRVVSLDEKGAQLFLYGRHLFARSLVDVKGRPEVGEEVLIVDAEDRFYLGLGIAEVALRPLARGGGRSDAASEVVVNNRLDLGLYLRGQQAIPE